MASVKLYLDTRKPLKDGRYSLKFIIQHKGNSMIPLNISLGADQLNESQISVFGYEVVNTSQNKYLNTTIERRYLEVKRLLMSLEENGSIHQLKVADIKRMIEGKTNEANENPLLKTHFDRFISLKNKQRTKDIYLDTYKKIEKFTEIGSLTFDAINIRWLRDFESHLLESCSTNTVSIHLRNLRAVFNDAINEDVIEQNFYPFRKFKIRSEVTKKRSLTVDQLRNFLYLECPPHQERYRDVFILIFYFIGINLVDLLNLKEINNGNIEYTRAKTNRPYSIKVEPEALDIINKYKGKKYLINILDTYSDYRHFTSKINSELKKISSTSKDEKGNDIVKPLFPYLTTYYARHTWATIAASLDIPKETIAAALGHGGNTVTDIYINFDQKKINEANRKVIDYVLNKKSKNNI